MPFVAKSEDLVRRDRPQKNMLAVLVGGIPQGRDRSCEWHVRGYTQQLLMPGIVLFFIPFVAKSEDFLRRDRH